MTTIRRVSGTVLVAVPLLASCGGSGAGLDQNGRPGTGGNGSTLTADLQSIQEHVFTPICTACHVGASAPLGFRLDDASAFAMLVNAPSVEVPSLRRVAPGDPDSSYLIQKLEGHAAVGGQMPLGQAPLPQATINIIRQWIADGAAPSPAAAVDTITRLSAIVPADDEIMTRTLVDPVIAATGALELGSINAGNFTIERSSSGDFAGAADTTRVTGARLSIRSRNPAVLALDLPAAQRIPGTYRLTLRGTGPMPVLDARGQPIRNFVLRYTIEDIP